jgi:hypothetical protein
MTAAMQLDHIVINVQRGMDEAEATFAALGFHLTPRGFHTLGSMNALAMFGTDYLELLGFPADGEIARPELASAPLGLNGLVFKSSDVDETFAHLKAVGVAGDPPKSFSRPVTLANGETHDAKFRTVAVQAEAFPAARFYFCEHLTPDMVWRPEWQSHANGATRFTDMTVVSADAAATADLIARIIGSTAVADGDAVSVTSSDGFRLLCQTPDQCTAKYDAAARAIGDRAAMLGAVTIKSAIPGEVRSSLAGDARFTLAEADGELRVLVNAFEAVVAFRP